MKIEQEPEHILMVMKNKLITLTIPKANVKGCCIVIYMVSFDT